MNVVALLQLEYVDSEYSGRVTVDIDDAVVIKYLLRRDAGPWRCAVLDAEAYRRASAQIENDAAWIQSVDGGTNWHENALEEAKRISSNAIEARIVNVKIDYTFFHQGFYSTMVSLSWSNLGELVGPPTYALSSQIHM